MNARKTRPAFLALGFAAIALSGCGGGSSSSPAPVPPPAPAAPAGQMIEGQWRGYCRQTGKANRQRTGYAGSAVATIRLADYGYGLDVEGFDGRNLVREAIWPRDRSVSNVDSYGNQSVQSELYSANPFAVTSRFEVTGIDPRNPNARVLYRRGEISIRATRTDASGRPFRLKLSRVLVAGGEDRPHTSISITCDLTR